jgi:hypothetical protein
MSSFEQTVGQEKLRALDAAAQNDLHQEFDFRVCFAKLARCAAGAKFSHLAAACFRVDQRGGSS